MQMKVQLELTKRKVQLELTKRDLAAKQYNKNI
jgi:hypothetical protein